MAVVAIDTETTGLNPWLGDRPFMISWYDGKTCNTIRFDVDPYTRKVTFDTKHTGSFVAIITNEKIEKVFHNAKFDLRMLTCLGFVIRGPIHDTIIAARCCNSNEPSYGLKKLSEKYLQIPQDDQTVLQKATVSARHKAKKEGYRIGNAVEQDYWLCPDFCQKYCEMDVIRTYKLWEFFYEGMKQLNVMHSYQQEMRLLPVLFDVESRGVRIDLRRIDKEIETNELIAKRETTNIMKAAGRDINLNSPKQMQQFLIDELKIPIEKPTKSGKGISTDTTALQPFKDHPVIDSILRYRGAVKGANYFKDYLTLRVEDRIKTYDDFGDWTCWAVHPNFNQANTRTWRLSCDTPNLQNVANPETSGGDYVTNARTAFIPRNGYKWYLFDYSQLEARIFAARAGEETMLAAFRDGRDLHDECGKRAFGSSMPEGQRRKLAKNIFFCKIFGGGPGVLAEKYKVSYEEAKKILQEYDAQFPGIKEHLSKMAKFAEEHGYIINAYNRKINVESDRSYAATNYDVQSSACDLMKRAMIKIHRYLKENPKYDAHIVLTIHDELVIEIRNDHCYRNLLLILQSCMEDHGGVFDIPTPVKIAKTSTRWSEKVEVKL